jgi:hypothetical protein
MFTPLTVFIALILIAYFLLARKIKRIENQEPVSIGWEKPTEALPVENYPVIVLIDKECKKDLGVFECYFDGKRFCDIEEKIPLSKNLAKRVTHWQYLPNLTLDHKIS